jgi:rhodanese-related sulfurtransferase
MKRVILVAALGLVAAISGCTRKTSDRDLQYVTPFEALERSNEAAGLFEKPVETAWVDPRPAVQYAQAHIPGAINLPFPRMTAEAEVVLKGYGRFVVYDGGEDDTIAKAASKRLMELGFDNVYTLEGGLKKWEKDHQSVEKGVPAPDAPSPARKP